MHFQECWQADSNWDLSCLPTGYFMNQNKKCWASKLLLNYFSTLQFPSENVLCTKISCSGHYLFPNLKLILNLNLFALPMHLYLFYPGQKFHRGGSGWLQIMLWAIRAGRRWLWDNKFFHSGTHPCFENPSSQTSTGIWICRYIFSVCWK